MLFGNSGHTTGLADAISDLDRRLLRSEYGRLIEQAPRRANRGKSYFVEHDGVSAEKRTSNRGEEHLAFRFYALKGFWTNASGERFRFLDYQFPLQARQSDKGIGKIDLVGVTDSGRVMVIELKRKPERENQRGETPLEALMQGLRYAAIVATNLATIATEAKNCFDVKIVEKPPIVQILASKAWWHGWLTLSGSTCEAAEEWEPAFAELVRDIESTLGVPVECMAHDDVADPRALYPVRPGKTSPFGGALPHRRGQ